jgi:hypothetical protein
MSGTNKLNEENGIATFVIAGRKLVRNSFQHANWNTKTSNIGLKRCLYLLHVSTRNYQSIFKYFET